MESFEKKMSVFSFQQHQDFVTYFKFLYSLSMTIEDVENYIKEKRELFVEEGEKRQKRLELWANVALKCPDCGTVMNLYPVNVGKGDQVGNGLNSQWKCSNCECDRYNEKTVKEVLKVLGL